LPRGAQAAVPHHRAGGSIKRRFRKMFHVEHFCRRESFDRFFTPGPARAIIAAPMRPAGVGLSPDTRGACFFSGTSAEPSPARSARVTAVLANARAMTAQRKAETDR